MTSDFLMASPLDFLVESRHEASETLFLLFFPPSLFLLFTSFLPSFLPSVMASLDALLDAFPDTSLEENEPVPDTLVAAHLEVAGISESE